MDWLGQIEYLKSEYIHEHQVATEFADALYKDGIRTAILKGFAFAQYYPNPELRYSCDFDCYFSDWSKGSDIAG